MDLSPRDAPADEFDAPVPLVTDSGGWTRRSFFKAMGLSASAAVLACRRAPVKEAIPFLVAPEEMVPGVPLYYASTCGACPAGCGVVVKTRDGRPIKIEGNALHPWSRGGACAVGQAAVLGLYDAARASGPMAGDAATTWAALDAEVAAALGRAAQAGRAIRLVTPLSVGPTGEAAIATFLAAFPTARRVRHDPLGLDAIAEAHRAVWGEAVIPAYRLDRARVIVGIDADFLGAWLSPVAFGRQYADVRHPDRAGRRARHLQAESAMTITGSKADRRFPLAPSDVVPLLGAIWARLDGEAPPRSAMPPMPAPDLDPARVDAIVAALRDGGRESLLLCGSPDPAAQALAAAIHQALGATGVTVDLDGGAPVPDAASMASFLDELRAGEVSVAVFLGVNPVYDHPAGAELGELLGRVDLAVSTADRRDETARRVRLLAPDHHPLEAWGDAQPARGLVGLCQPAVAPIFDTRSAWESLSTWAGAPRPAYEQLRDRWRAEVFPRAVNASLDFQSFWDASLEAGFAEVVPGAPPARVFRDDAVAGLLATRPASAAGAVLELAVHPSVSLRDGRLANNGWLQELPDPITKVTWQNVAAIAPATARRLGLSDGDVVRVAAGDRAIELPVLAQPGVHPRAVCVALGWGRTAAGKVGDGRGANAFALGASGTPVTIARAGRRVELPRSQTHASMEGRPLVREVALGEALERDPGRPASMWSGHAYTGHRWAMTIDLEACSGCSACVVACQAENNIPVVGADEVRRRREMHWLRIDRYYAGPADEPEVVHQPMLCQHCENAPCETVCPVLATVHSSEGLNQQVYNRCVGTRYCANNCPIKTRRFNWFDYPEDELARLVLNPDVVVRSRGVMEKCSFCVQRIQGAKAEARREGRPLRRDEVKTACQESCPAGAIVFGDLNDPESRVARLAASGRSYRILDEINLGSSIHYLARVRGGGGGP